MAVEDAEAPRREHQKAGARKEDSHDRDRQLPFVALEPWRDERYQQWRGKYPDQHENPRDEREQRRHTTSDARRLFPFLARDERGIDRNERCRQRAFAEQILEKIGNAEGRHECIGRVREAEILGEEPLADEAGQPAAEDAEGYERGGTIHSAE